MLNGECKYCRLFEHSYTFPFHVKFPTAAFELFTIGAACYARNAYSHGVPALRQFGLVCVPYIVHELRFASFWCTYCPFDITDHTAFPIISPYNTRHGLLGFWFSASSINEDRSQRTEKKR